MKKTLRISFPKPFLLLASVILFAGASPQLFGASGVAVMAKGASSRPGNPTDYYNGTFQLGYYDFTGYTNPALTSRISGQASADFGEIHLFNHAASPSYDFNESPSAYTLLKAGWVDTITINAPGLTGQAGTYNGAIAVHMVYSHNGGVGSNANYFSVRVGQYMGDESSAGDGQYGSLVMNENWPVSNGYGFNQSLAFSIPFTYGTPFDVAVTMYSNIRLDSANYDNQNVGYSVTHDAGNTVTWGGTVSVLDNNSAPVDLQDISMNSGSGTNYLAPIPEPSTTVLLLGAGVFGLALVRRRFRRG